MIHQGWCLHELCLVQKNTNKSMGLCFFCRPLQWNHCSSRSDPIRRGSAGTGIEIFDHHPPFPCPLLSPSPTAVFTLCLLPMPLPFTLFYSSRYTPSTRYMRIKRTTLRLPVSAAVACNLPRVSAVCRLPHRVPRSGSSSDMGVDEGVAMRLAVHNKKGKYLSEVGLLVGDLGVSGVKRGTTKS